LADKPEPVTPEWFADTLPAALDAAIDKLGPRYHAIVVDEGQDFDSGWLASLEGLLYDGREDVLYVFHDPAQSIFRDDQTGELGLTDYPLDFNCRNAKPIHDLIVPLAKGGLASIPRRTDGRDVELITADYVAWYNQKRLMHRLGRIPPAQAEAEHYERLNARQPAGSQNPEGA
jgi:hypothetical protein